MIQIRAGQAKGIFLALQRYPGSAPELLLAFSAGRVSGRDKNDDIVAFRQKMPSHFFLFAL